MIVAPVLVGDEVPAYLLTLHDGDPETGEDLRLLVTEHAATICGVILGRERVVAAAAARAREDLIEGLLSGKGSDADELLRWARHLGYDETREHRVLSLVVEQGRDGLGARVPVAIERFFGTRASDAITAVRDHEVVVVLPDRADRAESLTASCLDRVRELFPPALVTVGIGGRCGPPEGIARSYDDARRTVEAARRMGRTGSVVAFDELGIHRLLLQVADPAQLREFAHEVFGGLSTHPHAAVAEYLTTLGCYFRANNSPQRASRALHVHPNTVTYRVRRVEQITKLDFTHYRDRLMAQVALEILDAVGEGAPAVSPLRTGRGDDL
jgi:sugar diacid utilization regulator